MTKQMLEPLVVKPESIEIKNFLAIKSGKVVLDTFTVIIGPQATGKSIIAKLVFFGRNYIEEYIRSATGAKYDIDTFKHAQVEEFLGLFGGLDGYDKPFQVHYVLGDLEVSVTRKARRKLPTISMSESLETLGEQIQGDYGNYTIEVRKEDDKGQRHRTSAYLYRTSTDERRSFYDSLPSTLFIPASRSFFSTVSDHIFTFLDSEERIDKVMARFGSFYEFARRVVHDGGRMARNSKKFRDIVNELIYPVIDGNLVRKNSREYIETSWGLAPLPSASSGQQEALPLLLSLLVYPSKRKTSDLLIVEEPEAHLFPKSQKYILDQMVHCADTRKCSMLFTTHSPYIVACLNTHIARWNSAPHRDNSSLSAGGYLVSGGETRSILSSTDGLIDLDILDQVSEEINSEFLEAFGE